jgi:hypothetical protein
LRSHYSHASAEQPVGNRCGYMNVHVESDAHFRSSRDSSSARVI